MAALHSAPFLFFYYRTQVMRCILNAIILLCVLASAEKENFTFYLNGEHTDGVELVVPWALQTLSISDIVGRVHFLNQTMFAQSEIATARIFDSKGIVLNSTSDLVVGATYYIVAADLLWMWPSVNVGTKYEIEIDDGSDRPLRTVSIESINLSPRVFAIANILDDEEAETLKSSASVHLKVSTVGTIDIRTDPGRTSMGYFDSTTPTAKAIMARIYKILRIPYDAQSADGLPFSP
jgi:hypothetical protein